MGRLWHTLLLSKWNRLFAWLPVESIIHQRQRDYYKAINASNCAGESTVFIEFMLSAIKASLTEAIEMSDALSDASSARHDRAVQRWSLIGNYLQTHGHIQNADVRRLCGVSAATANRILGRLTEEKKLQRCREKGRWIYRAGSAV